MTIDHYRFYIPFEDFSQSIELDKDESGKMIFELQDNLVYWINEDWRIKDEYAKSDFEGLKLRKTGLKDNETFIFLFEKNNNGFPTYRLGIRISKEVFSGELDESGNKLMKTKFAYKFATNHMKNQLFKLENIEGFDEIIFPKEFK